MTSSEPLRKGATKAVPLEDANIRPERRFCYFDQPHTTGIDIQQPPLGVPWESMGAWISRDAFPAINT